MAKKQKSRWLFLGCLTLIFLILSTTGVFADTVTQDDVELVFTTDKTVYNYDEDIVVTVTINDNSLNDIFEVRAEPIVPAGLSVRPGSSIAVRNFAPIVAGGRQSFQYILYLSPPSPVQNPPAAPSVPATGDNRSLFGMIILSLLSLAGVAWVLLSKGDKKSLRMMSLLLFMVLLTGLVGAGAPAVLAADINHPITERAGQHITVGGTEFDLGLLLSCEMHLPDPALLKQYTVTYMPNGGTPNVAVIDLTDTNGNITLLKATDPNAPYFPPVAPNFYSRSLVKWNTQSDGNGTEYDLGSTIQLNNDLVLYAVWGPIFV